MIKIFHAFGSDSDAIPAGYPAGKSVFLVLLTVWFGAGFIPVTTIPVKNAFCTIPTVIWCETSVPHPESSVIVPVSPGIKYGTGGIYPIPPGIQPIAGGIHPIPHGIQLITGRIYPIPPGIYPITGGIHLIPHGIQPITGGIYPIPHGIMCETGGIYNVQAAIDSKAGVFASIPRVITFIAPGISIGKTFFNPAPRFPVMVAAVAKPVMSGFT
jgi:hypothetical protein